MATKSAAKPSSIASSSRPNTPAPAPSTRSMTPANNTPAKPKKEKVEKVVPAPPPPPRSPTSSIAVDSDIGSHDVPTTSASPEPLAVPSIPPGLPAVPPGLTAPPGLPAPNKAAQTGQTYQMSTAAQALLNDVKARRESALPITGISPFPDFDRTLQTLTENNDEFGGFSFNLDPKLASGSEDAAISDIVAAAEPPIPFQGTFVDAFPALRNSTYSPSPMLMNATAMGYPLNSTNSIYDPSRQNQPTNGQQSTSPLYTGSFNPFADSGDNDPATTARRLALDEDPSRKMSRFGFARGGRQGGSTMSSTSSPMATTTPLSPTDSVNQSSMYGTNDVNSPASQWSYQQQQQQQQTQQHQQQQPQQHAHQQQHQYNPHSASATSSPMLAQAQAQAQVHALAQQHHRQHQNQQAARFQPFDHNSGTEDALRQFIESSRDRNRSVAGRGSLGSLAGQLLVCAYQFHLKISMFGTDDII